MNDDNPLMILNKDMNATLERIVPTETISKSTKGYERWCRICNSRNGRRDENMCTFFMLPRDGVRSIKVESPRSWECYRAGIHLAEELRAACWHGAPLGACRRPGRQMAG